MPDAEKFTALGAGNGFPIWGQFVADDWTDNLICLEKVDVTDISDHWNPMTLGQAMQVFWNLQKVNGTATTTFGNPPTFIETVTATNNILGWSNFDPDDPITADDREPVKRVCNRHIADAGNLIGQDLAIDYLRASDPLSSTDLGSTGIITSFAKPQRLYEGSIDDEANFIGYGFGGEFSPWSRIWSDVDATGLTYKEEAYFSYAKDDYNTQVLPIGAFSEEVVSGIPLIKYSVETTDPNVDGTAEAVIGDIDFYTYPAS